MMQVYILFYLISSQLVMIYSSVCTYSLYKKLKNQSNQGTATAMYSTVQNLPNLQHARELNEYSQAPTHLQPQVHNRYQVYNQPEVYPLHQAYQQSISQHNSKLEEENQLSSYESIVPSTP